MSTEERANAELGRCPLPQAQVVDQYFMEHRAKLIDIAAFLDRLDRASDAPTSSDDFRVQAFRRAIAVLSDGDPRRAQRVLESFSDFSTEVPVSAHGLKGASGAAPASSEG